MGKLNQVPAWRMSAVARSRVLEAENPLRTGQVSESGMAKSWVRGSASLVNDMETNEDDKTTYQVVVNHEEQYSIWPGYKDLPAGWKAVGKQGNKEECLACIKEIWTDMRPLSLRRAMESAPKPN